jgi:type IV secretory pathway TraG/TraD family ATPase VirD4
MDAMRLRNRQQPTVSPSLLLELGGGHALTMRDIYAHILVMGSSNAGKSFSTEPIIAGAHRLGCPIMATCVKPDEFERYRRITRGERLVRLAPGCPYRINMLDYVYKSYGSAEAVSEFICRLNDAMLRTGPNAQQEQYWANLFDMSALNAIKLVAFAFGEISVDAVYMTLTTAPRNKEDAKIPEIFERSFFGKVLKQAIANRTDENEHDIERAMEFFVSEFAQLGDKGQAAVLSMVAGTLGRLTSGPFRDAFNGKTNMTPERIESEKLTVCLDYPLLKWGAPARLFQLAWVILFQDYCLRRDASTRDTVSLLVRDEAQYSLSPQFDMMVQTVARSQKLAMMSLIQDIDVLTASLGGDARAETEAYGWISNHQTKLLFSNSNARTGDFFEKCIGDHRQFFHSVSSAPGKPECQWEHLLGIGQFSFSSNQQMRPYVTASDLASLPQASCVVHQAGRSFDGKPYLLANLWRGQ